MVARKPFHLWRAVDQQGIVLEEILQSKRSKKVTKRLLIRQIKRKDFIPFLKAQKHDAGLPSTGWAERFGAIHTATRNCFSVPARRPSADTIRYHGMEAFDAWKAATNIA